MKTQPRLRPAGLSLTEVLIVIVIIVIIVAIMFPLVSGFRERARAAVCAQNLRQIGVGLNGYVTESNGRFPMGGDDISKKAGGVERICWYDAAADNLGRDFEFKPRGEWERLPEVFGCPAGHGKAYINEIQDGTNANGWPYTGDYAANWFLGNDLVAENSRVMTLAAVKNPSATPYVQDTVCQNNFGAGIFSKGASRKAWMDKTRRSDPTFADRHAGKGNILWVDGHVSSMGYSEYMDYATDPAHGGPNNFVRGKW
jgi:prepilin-type processing-associated H-X9-DG protein